MNSCGYKSGGIGWCHTEGCNYEGGDRMLCKQHLHDFASERAMQMICAVTCSSAGTYDQMLAVKRVVNAWVYAPRTLTDAAKIESLPEPR
jgi:hypothetical protein